MPTPFEGQWRTRGAEGSASFCGWGSDDEACSRGAGGSRVGSAVVYVQPWATELTRLEHGLPFAV